MAAGGPIAGIAATTDVTAPLTAPIAPCHNASLVLAPDVFALKYASIPPIAAQIKAPIMIAVTDLPDSSIAVMGLLLQYANILVPTNPCPVL